MAYPLRLQFDGAIYRVTSRGNAGEDIFDDDGDRHTFLECLGKVVHHLHFFCHANCLMGNHYPLVIETPEANFSKGMRQLNGRYMQTFNRRHNRVGYLLQGRVCLRESLRYEGGSVLTRRRGDDRVTECYDLWPPRCS